MAITPRSTRKFTDADVIRLNSVGLSLYKIAEVMGCHPSTVTSRLKGLGVQPADTRRTFMEDIFLTLTEDQQEWLADQLGPALSIKEFVRNLLIEKYINRKQ